MNENDKVQDLSDAVPVIEESTGTLMRVGLPAVVDLENQIQRMALMEKYLEKSRRACIHATVPGDWVMMGKALYLEGDGGLRMAPLIGLEMLNVRKEIRVIEDEVSGERTTAVTISADFESKLFGTRFDGISRTRTDRDGFLTQNGKIAHADLADVEASAYKGCIARGAQLLAGLSGLSPAEMAAKFGFAWSGSAVDFKSGQADAKREDQQQTAGTVAEIQKLARKLSMGDQKLADKILIEITTSDEKGIKGTADVNRYSEKRAEYVLNMLKKRETVFDKELAEADQKPVGGKGGAE